jgi:hypothetical protein
VDTQVRSVRSGRGADILEQSSVTQNGNIGFVQFALANQALPTPAYPADKALSQLSNAPEPKGGSQFNTLQYGFAGPRSYPPWLGHDQ